MQKLTLITGWFFFFFFVFHSSVYAVPEESTSSQKPPSSYKPYCWNTHMVDQMAVCSKTHTQCVNKCTPLGNSGGQVPCLNQCSKTLDLCFKQSSADYHACIEAEKNQPAPDPIITSIDIQNDDHADKQLVGLSSKDFKALARANAEYQKAQADLEKIKESNDPRWEDKKDFSSKVADDTGETLPDTILENLERIKDGVSVALDIGELYGLYTSGELGPYSGVSLVADVGNGVIIFTELVGNGVSVENAATKSFIDTVAPNLFAPVKVADIIATMPDKIMNAIGIAENDPWRRPTIFLKESAAPSTFIENTTDAMITTQNFSNMGGIVQMAVTDFQSAEGFGEKIQEGINLIGTVVGAIPVAVVLLINDAVSANISIGETVVNFVSNTFTYFPY